MSTIEVVAGSSDARKASVAALYDCKTRDADGLNAVLASRDGLFFNHNGIYLLDRPAPTCEVDRLDLLHRLEADLVSYGLKHLGNPTADGVVLDAGCGAGGGATMIHERFGCAVDGVTLSPEQARFATATAQARGIDDRVSFKVADMLEIYRSATVDGSERRYQAVWACESTEHIDDLGLMFAVFDRVLVADGRIVVIAWCAGIGVGAGDVKERVDERYCTNIHQPHEYEQAARDAGLVACERVDLTAWTVPYWKMRLDSSYATGTEELMFTAFKQRLMTYELFCFATPK
ncbi:methyltransferase domain-containing protein [Mycobacterium vicinigordonae]|uniref:Methyltransferase domain-containing protein n=1 Tax=Mycobacterium vicinigordonae TaxID=1719132 RepID=A0A7D6IMN0_9MYCO|nr:methyltransferase domain-containing protein [Mycobacterium vicinigordonae]QLL07860.1 methyltransferase domain-containing protein [Mycobacterium vicinigordonae]